MVRGCDIRLALEANFFWEKSADGLPPDSSRQAPLY
jgi:hypothetical protein